MSERTVTIWTCDRCGARREMGDRYQPPGWERIDHRQPPRNAEYTEFGTICATCSDQFRDWWIAGTAGPAEGRDTPS